MFSCDPRESYNGRPDFAATLFREEGGTPIVSVFGEVDLFTVCDLSVLMLKAISEAGAGGSVIVDLGGVGFIDCSGIKPLINGQSVLDDSGGTLAVVCGGSVRRLLEAADLEDEFKLYPDLASAVGGIKRPRAAS